MPPSRAGSLPQGIGGDSQNAALPTDAPPSTNSVCPVMNPLCSDSRNVIAEAISWGCPRRPIGTLARYRASPSLPGGLLARNSSVSVGPGATAFTVTPLCASSSAHERVKLTSAAWPPHTRCAGQSRVPSGWKCSLPDPNPWRACSATAPGWPARPNAG